MRATFRPGAGGVKRRLPIHFDFLRSRLPGTLPPDSVAAMAAAPFSDDSLTAARLRALGNAVRFSLYRMLVRAGEAGLAAGEVQARLGVPPSTLTHHLKTLEAAGLIRRRREGNLLRCVADFTVMQALVDRLAAECCADAQERRE